MHPPLQLAQDTTRYFIATTISHGIPARAVAIGLIIGSINAIIILAGALLLSGDLAAVSVVVLGQAYALPLLFGVLSQAISYRRAAHLVNPGAVHTDKSELLRSVLLQYNTNRSVFDGWTRMNAQSETEGCR